MLGPAPFPSSDAVSAHMSLLSGEHGIRYCGWKDVGNSPRVRESDIFKKLIIFIIGCLNLDSQR